MKHKVITASGAGPTAWVPRDQRAQVFSIGLGAVVAPGSTLTYTVEHTFDNIWNPNITPTAFPNTGMTAQTASSQGNYAFPVRAVRLNVTSYTSGSVTLTVIQTSGQS